jgi:hypothetical protein
MASTDEIVLSQADLDTLNTVPSIDIFVNVSSVADVCSQWQSQIDGLNIDVDKIASTFKPLTSYGILTNYITGLSTAIASLLQSVKTVTTTISNSSNSHNDSENGINTYDSSGSGYTTGSGYNTYSGSSTEANNSGANTETPATEAEISSITYQDYIGLATILYSIAKANNIDFSSLTNDIVFEKVKSTLLSSKFLTKDLRDKLATLSDSSLKSMIKLMNQNGTFENFTVDNVEFVEQYLTKLAKMNNTDLNGYINSSKSLVYNEMYYLNNALTYIEVASKTKNFNAILRGVLDGSDIGDIGDANAIAIRNVINLVADQNKKSAEDLVNSCSVNDFKKAINAGYLVNDLLYSNTGECQSVLSTLTS